MPKWSVARCEVYRDGRPRIRSRWEKKLSQVTLLAYLNGLEFVSEQGGFLVFTPKIVCRKIIFQP